MTHLTITLRLSTDLISGTRDRCPFLAIFDGDHELSAIRSDTELPMFPYVGESIESITIHDDALSRVIDEEAWLAELSRVLAPGGELRCTLPTTGAFAWLDALNLYRYIVDISGRGDPPDAVLPAGWGKHYSRGHIQQLFHDAGFEEIAVGSTSHMLDELRIFNGLLVGNWLRKDRTAEYSHVDRFGRRSPDDKHIGPRTTWIIRARKHT